MPVAAGRPWPGWSSAPGWSPPALVVPSPPPTSFAPVDTMSAVFDLGTYVSHLKAAAC